MSYDSNSNNETGSDHSGGLISHQESEPASMPIGLADDSFDDFSGDPAVGAAMDPYAASGKGGSGILMFVVFLLVAGGVLWTMRKTGGVLQPSKASAANEAKIDLVLKQYSGEGAKGRNSIKSLFGDTDDMLLRLSKDTKDNQVQLDEVQKNPFKIGSLLGTNKSGDDNDNKVASLTKADRQKLEKLKKLNSEFGMLSLQSIIIGKQSAAFVSGQLVRVGTTIGQFKVTAIKAKVVELVAGKTVFTLKLKTAK